MCLESLTLGQPFEPLMTRSWWSALSLLVLAGCATVTPRFSQPVQADFAHSDMRVLETPSVELYYPAPLKAEALRVAARINGCVDLLRALAHDTRSPRLVIYLTDANFDNAYVQPQVVGYPQQMVIPLHMSLELFNLLGFGASEIGDIACHESVHYVQMQQNGGFWHAINTVFGDVMTPNVFTESWFLEGLAVVYEGRLEKSVGRPHSPIWTGMFESIAAAKHGQLGGGDLSPASRDEIPFGGSYLIGEHFVDFLARRYGEDKLWALIQKQGDSVFSPFGVTLRFKAVYGKTLGGLLDEFDQELARTIPQPTYPPDQTRVAGDLGPFPRMAAGPDGAIAVISERRDDVPRLEIRDPDGHLRVDRRLTPLLPPRRWIEADTELVSGMDFTADGRWLFLVMSDLGSQGEDVARLWKVDARTGEVVQVFGPLSGMGGTVRPDGGAYVYVRLDQDVANLVERDLATGAERALTHFRTKTTLGAPAYAPDGKRIAYSGWTGSGFDLFLREPDGTTRALTHDGRFNYSPRWIDESHLLFLREVDRHAQAHVLDLSTGELRQVTHAPFLAMDPAPLPGGRLALLNREGITFTLDTAPLTSSVATAGAPVQASLTPAVPEPASLDASSPAPPSFEDRGYHFWDHLLVPNLRVPLLEIAQDAEDSHAYDVLVALSLQGQDRLGLHQWAINFSQTTHQHGPSFDLTYANSQLAPWYLSATYARAADYGVFRNPDDSFSHSWTTDQLAAISASRSFWDIPVSLSVLGLRTTEQDDDLRYRSQVVGARLSTGYSAADGSAYGGTQHGLSLTGSAAFFPKAVGSDFQFGDLRAQLSAVMPLPLSSRHSLTLSVSGRSLVGAPDALLRVGGVINGYQVAASEPLKAEPGPGVFFPSLTFSEYLRGYEDARIRTRDVAIANARYQFHFVIDRGTTSFLYLFPSFFVRQVDLEAFGAWARTRGADSGNHRVAGATINLRTLWGGAAPATLFYQFAYRFDDGLGPYHLFGIALQ